MSTGFIKFLSFRFIVESMYTLLPATVYVSKFECVVYTLIETTKDIFNMVWIFRINVIHLSQ